MLPSRLISSSWTSGAYQTSYHLRLKYDDTEVLLTRFLTPDFLPLLRGLRGIDVAAIGAVPGAMLVFEDVFTVTLHGEDFVIYEGILSGTEQAIRTEPRGG